MPAGTSEHGQDAQRQRGCKLSHQLSSPLTFVVMPVEGLPGVMLMAMNKELKNGELPDMRYFDNPMDMAIHIAAVVCEPQN